MTDIPNCLSVVFPGIVNNVDKFMPLIGGMSTLEKVCNTRSDRLEMRFRPQDVYSHAVYGDKVKVDQLLVKVKRKKITYSDGSEEVVFETKVMGVIEFSYQFSAMCDFQYLPMERTSSGSYRSIIDEVIPANALDPSSSSSPAKEFNPNAPLRILPTIFSRFDMPVEYYYKDGPNLVAPERIEIRARREKESQIGRIRKSRAAATTTITWSMLADHPAPTDVRADAIEAYEKEIVDQTFLPRLKQLFEEHPIYTRNKLLYLLECNATELRFLLPLVAYSITDGPFRKSWSRLGYNPRSDASSLKYQIMDFRIKRHDIRAKRSVYQYQLPLQRGEESNPRNKRFMPATVINESLLLDSVLREQQMRDEQRKQERQVLLRGQFVFAPGLMPSISQILCQLLDIELDLVKNMIAEGTDRSEPDEKDGWLPAGAIEKIRTEMSRVLEETIAAHRTDDDTAGGDGDLPGPSSQPLDDSLQQDDDDDEEEDDSDNELDCPAIDSLKLR